MLRQVSCPQKMTLFYLWQNIYIYNTELVKCWCMSHYIYLFSHHFTPIVREFLDVQAPSRQSQVVELRLHIGKRWISWTCFAHSYRLVFILAKRPLILSLQLARIFRDSYLISLSYLFSYQRRRQKFPVRKTAWSFKGKKALSTLTSASFSSPCSER